MDQETETKPKICLISHCDMVRPFDRAGWPSSGS